MQAPPMLLETPFCIFPNYRSPQSPHWNLVSSFQHCVVDREHPLFSWVQLGAEAYLLASRQCLVLPEAKSSHPRVFLTCALSCCHMPGNNPPQPCWLRPHITKISLPTMSYSTLGPLTMAIPSHWSVPPVTLLTVAPLPT